MFRLVKPGHHQRAFVETPLHGVTEAGLDRSCATIFYQDLGFALSGLQDLKQYS